MLATDPQPFENTLSNPKMICSVYQTFAANGFQPALGERDEHQLTNLMMDIVDGSVVGKQILVGYTFKNSEWKCTPDEETVQTHSLLTTSKKLFQNYVSNIHGVLFGTGIRRIYGIDRARWGILARWAIHDRTKYEILLVNPRHGHKFRGN